jgi:stage IV sporulation protein FB
MAWQDRPYYRERGTGSWDRILWLLNGSVPLFTAFGIRVRAHASLILTVILVLAIPTRGFYWPDRVESMVALFVIVLLHEFGHCFAARWMGGDADEILMHPLGGFAFANPPRRPWPTFVTVAGGPAVNVLICIAMGAIVWAGGGTIRLNPFDITPPHKDFSHWFDVSRYAFWIYQMSLTLLAFNLLPIYPLDGGRMVQTMLWPKLGYYRSMLISCMVGMVAAVLGAMIALASFRIWLAALAAMGFITCLQMRRQLIAMGPEEYADETDYSAAYEQPTPTRRRKKVSRRVIKKARMRAQRAAQEQQRIDTILAKVSSHGLASLTWSERRALRKATEKQRKRDLELSRL